MICKFKNYFVFEMSSINDKITGINDIFIWVGEKNTRHGHRIKVSNIKGSYKNTDSFSIRIHDLKIDGVCKLDKKSINKINKFILINRTAIEDFSNSKITFYDFIKNIKSV